MTDCAMCVLLGKTHCSHQPHQIATIQPPSTKTQELVLEACLEHNHLRSAGRLARESGQLPAAARDRLNEAVLAKLLAEGAWGPALARARGSRELEERVLAGLVQTGELDIARELAEELGLPGPTDAEATAAALARQQRFLALPVAPEAIVFVSSAEGIRAVESWLHDLARSACSPHSAPVVVGLDAEWAPDDLPGGDPPATGAGPISTLQLASSTRAFVLDVLALTRDAVLQDLLRAALRALAAPAIIKAGCGLANDLSRLRQVLGAEDPDVILHNCLELGQLRSYSGLGLWLMERVFGYWYAAITLVLSQKGT